MLVDDLNQSGTSFRQRISNQFHCQKEALQRECSTEQGQIDLFFRQKYQHVLPLSLMAHNGQYQYNVLILYLGGQGTAESGRDIRINVKPVFICGLKSKLLRLVLSQMLLQHLLIYIRHKQSKASIVPKFFPFLISSTQFLVCGY